MSLVTCRELTVFVPDDLAPVDGQARVRALFFAQFGAQMRMPDVWDLREVEGGWVVRIVEREGTVAR